MVFFPQIFFCPLKHFKIFTLFTSHLLDLFQEKKFLLLSPFLSMTLLVFGLITLISLSYFQYVTKPILLFPYKTPWVLNSIFFLESNEVIYIDSYHSILSDLPAPASLCSSVSFTKLSISNYIVSHLNSFFSTLSSQRG